MLMNEGHGFSRAVKTSNREGFKVCVRTGLMEWSPEGTSELDLRNASVSNHSLRTVALSFLSSRAKPRDLRFRGHLLETQNTMFNRIVILLLRP